MGSTDTYRVVIDFGDHVRLATVTGVGICKYCQQAMIWGELGNGKFVPLQPGENEPGIMAPHRCTPRLRPHYNSPAPALPEEGIPMSAAIWRALLRLIHPDKHHGGEDERLAHDLTCWLLDQRSRLKK
jgi:hypothetical protein